MRVGVLSDTHNLLRPRVPELLAGCDRILHAGDVGDLAILKALNRIAPVQAVRGNTDSGATAARLPEDLAGEIDGLAFRMVHRREDAAPSWIPGLRLLVFGHSHRPELEWQGACLLLNPGACGAPTLLVPPDARHPYDRRPTDRSRDPVGRVTRPRPCFGSHLMAS